MHEINPFLEPMDAETIINTPLQSRRHGDYWAWHYDKKECSWSARCILSYVVDTRERRMTWLDENMGTYDSRGAEKEWTSLWQVKVPSKL
jgi:hypothetical protein